MASGFMWYELQTSDSAAAEAFYRAVVGWSTTQMGEGPTAYTTFDVPRGGIAGMVQLPPDELPKGPVWVGYVGVDDVDADAARLAKAGGTVFRGPVDIPGIGRFAGVRDPGGAEFVLFHGTAPEGPPTGAADEPGFAGWHELMAADGAAAFDFYAGLFGWTQTGVFDMGPMGAYQLWTDGRGRDAGGMMTKPPGSPTPHWNIYFQVESVEAAAGRIKAGGGAVTNGPMQVPSGAWIVQGSDPQGGAFSLVSAAK